MAEKKAKSDDFRYIIRISNTDINGEKNVVDALRKIKGVSFMFANAICQAAGISRTAQAGLLADADIKKLQEALSDPKKAGIPAWVFNRRRDPESGEDNHVVTNDLIIAQEDDIKRLKKIKSYRGVRHQNRLPLRGQRTRSNFRSNKGKKR
jgi:small subunit ribosomal protein S13